MKQVKKISIFLFLVLFLLCAMTFTALAIELPPINTGGNTGPSLDAENEALFSYTSFNRQITITGLKKDASGALAIPETLGGYPIVEIDVNAFQGQTGITSVTMPDTITSIDANVFDGCTALESITLSDTLTSIGACAFNGCSSLTEITIPESVKTIRYGAFAGCTSLAEISLSESITSAGPFLFDNTPWLASQPDGPLYVGKVLYTCIGTSPAQVIVKAGTLEIAEEAFLGKTTLEQITFPESLKFIGNSAFMGCSSLDNLYLPANVGGIYYNTFAGCSSLETVTASEDGKYIVSEGCVIEVNEDEGFYTIVFATEFATIPTDVPLTAVGEGVFSGRVDLINVALPESVTTVDLEAFSYCSNLESVSMPGVTEISIFAFQNCSSLKEIYISSALETVGAFAFEGCSALTDVHFDGTRAQKKQVTIDEGNDPLNAATWHTLDAAKDGDLDEDGTVSSSDAIYLLYYTLFGEDRYPISGDCDFDGDGTVASSDAIYLLYHTLFGEERYPL